MKDLDLTHESGQCPGLGVCPNSWHEGGCDPYWQYCREDYDISRELYAEDDATEKRLWEGPDEPSQVWTRATADDPWVRVDAHH